MELAGREERQERSADVRDDLCQNEKAREGETGNKTGSHCVEQRPDTLREMLVALVTQGVEEYNARRDDGKLLGYLTAEQIEEKAGTGKVSFGFRNGSDAEADPAVENALQCFQDGIYRVFAGQRELTELEERIPWEEEPVFTLIRLVMLAGL